MRRWIIRLALLLVTAALIPACGIDGPGITTGGGPGTTTGVLVSGLQLLARGGAGTVWDGGQGGNFTFNGQTGSALRMYMSGSVNSVAMPNVVAPDLGTNPILVTANATWNVGVGGELVLGDPELYAVSGAITGDNTDPVATGLHIAAGVTLTILPNNIPPPAAPVLVDMDAGTGGIQPDQGPASLRVNWDPAPGATSYRVFANVNGGGFVQVVPDILGGGSNTYLDPGPYAPGVDFVVYEVYALNAGGISGPSTTTSTTTDLLGTNPAPPAGVAVAGAPQDLRLQFMNGVYIQGTLKVGLDDPASDNTANFILDVGNDGSGSQVIGSNLVIASTGRIDLVGQDDEDGIDPDTFGGNGGSLTTISQPGGFFSLTDYSLTSTIINAGTIDSRGGVGTAGGSGGDVTLAALNYGVFNSGTVDASGGEGTAVYPAAPILNVAASNGTDTVYTLEGGTPPPWLAVGNTLVVSGCNNSANNGTFTILALAGMTITVDNQFGVAELACPGVVAPENGSGGSGGDILLRSDYGIEPIFGGAVLLPGGVFNSGSLLSLGADGAGDGGSGGDIDLDGGDDGANTSSGTIDASGGDATVEGFGGSGGNVSFKAAGTLRVTGDINSLGGDGAGDGDGGQGGDLDLTTLTSSMALGANIDVSGGDGEDGGDAGDIDITTGDDQAFLGSQGAGAPGLDLAWIVGYDSINVSGGDGPDDGGDAGDIDIFNDSRQDNGGVTYFALIRNEIPLIARGGAGAAEFGGDGGDVDIATADGGPNTSRSVVNTANIDVSGGDGGDEAGDGGFVFFYDTWRVENSGDILADGASSTTSGLGGSGGGVQLLSDDVIVNTGDLSASGGDSVTGGGDDGGVVLLFSRNTFSQGNLTADGGAGPIQGGNGGVVALRSSEVSTTVHGILSVSAAPRGLGAPTSHGLVEIDGFFPALTLGKITIP